MRRVPAGVWLLLPLLLAALAPLAGALNLTHFPRPAALRRSLAASAESDETRWLVSLNCSIGWERVDVVARELQNVLNGCFMETAGQGARTAALRLRCVFAVPDRAALAAELLRVVGELLLLNREPAACTRGPLFGISADERTRTTTASATATSQPPLRTQSPAPWHLDTLDQFSGYDFAYRYAYDGTGVTVYNMDSGVTAAHAEFGGRASTLLDLIDGGTVSRDPNGHGTCTTSLNVGASTGVAKNATLVELRVLDADGYGYMSDLIYAMTAVADLQSARAHPAVVSMSLSGGANALLDAYANSLVSDAKVAVVVAAGNSGDDAALYSPGRAANVLCIGAHDYANQLAGFSNRGARVALLAGGVNVRCATPASTTSFTNGASGTSMSTPIAAGAVALIMQEMLPVIDGAQAQALLVARSRALGSARISGYAKVFTGAGLPALPPAPPQAIPNLPNLPNEPDAPSSGAAPRSAPFVPALPAPPGLPVRPWWTVEPDVPYVLRASTPGVHAAWPTGVWGAFLQSFTVCLLLL